MLLAIAKSLALFLSGFTLLLSSMLFCEIISAWLYNKKDHKGLESSAWVGKMAVLVPAYNEELLIQNTLSKIQEQLNAQDRLIVVADNCNDLTAVISRSMGAEVLERSSTEHRGKGYALDFGLKYLEQEPPDLVAIVDADCELEAKALTHLKQQVLETGLPAQAVYLFEQPAISSTKDKISSFALKVKNLIRPLGLHQLGLSYSLVGTGMGFPWSVLETIDLASGNIVEDMKLSLDLAIAGFPAQFCVQARVKGKLPQSEQASTVQRTRWEHGHLQLAMDYFPLLLKSALLQKKWSLVFVALDLVIPPLAFFVTFWILLTISLVILGCTIGFWFPNLISISAGVILVTAILLAWSKFGRQELPFLQLLTVPTYILWKMPLYFKFLYKPQSIWVRTNRDG